jgi:hypothetical protein
VNLGDALVDALLRAVDQGRPRLRVVAEWIAEVARPPRGLRLVADDGAEYSGVVIVEHSEPVLMLALCVSGPRRREACAPHPRSFDDPLWRSIDDQSFP